MAPTPSKSRRNSVAAILVVVCLIAVGGGYIAKRYLFPGPLLVIENNSGTELTAISFRDGRTSGRPSKPGSWPSLAQGGRIVYSIRGDDNIELTYTMNGQIRSYSQYTPVGPIEAWVVRIKEDGTAEGNFAHADKY